MKDQLIKLRSIIRETCDRLDSEKLSTGGKIKQRNMIVQYLELASIKAGALLREMNED